MLAQLEHVGDQAGETGRSRTASPGDRQEAEPQQGFGGSLSAGALVFFPHASFIGLLRKAVQLLLESLPAAKRSAP